METKILSISIICVILAFVIELVRREKLTFKYAAGWILAAVAAIFFVVFDQYICRLSEWLGFVLPSNFIFFALLCGFVFLSLLLTIFVCQQDNRNTIIAQKMGLLKQDLEQLKKDLNQNQKVKEE
jgi:hypothetical protein